MTTYESYYLMMVLAAFASFAAMVAGTTLSYHRWLRRQRPGGGR